MSKTIAILQSNYIPWKGYFDIIAAADEFIIFDDMQYTRRDWRNRNLIKTPQGIQWLTVPVKVKGKYLQTIRETQIEGTEWASIHWKTFIQYYGRTPYFNEISSILEPIYLDNKFNNLSELNRELIAVICKYLGIKTKISHSWDYSLIDGKTERLVSLCTQAGGTKYISGISAKSYIDEKLFHDQAIEIMWFNYSGYAEYPQKWGQFIHQVSILDLLFNCGQEALKYMKYTTTSIDKNLQNAI